MVVYTWTTLFLKPCFVSTSLRSIGVQISGYVLLSVPNLLGHNVHHLDMFIKQLMFLCLSGRLCFRVITASQGVSQPPEMLGPSERPSGQESIEITVIKLLLQYCWEECRGLSAENHHALSGSSCQTRVAQRNDKKPCRSYSWGCCKIPGRISLKRKQTRDTLKKLEEMPLEAESVERGHSSGSVLTGLPKLHGFPLSPSMNNVSHGFYACSPNHHKSRKSSSSFPSHSGELQSHHYPMVHSQSIDKDKLLFLA
ncbi:hypothetical protein LINPERHAP2_LOCUS15874 [Linum perenne]